MNVAIAVLTYNRLPALQHTLKGLLENIGAATVAVFEDGGYRDNTVAWLTKGRKPLDHDVSGESIEWIGDNDDPEDPFHVFIGTKNLGVAGNSNRAIRWFYKGNADVLILCNDDLDVTGDLAKVYREAHKRTGIHLFCRTDIKNQETGHGWTTVPYRGLKLRISTRLTGQLMSLTRELVKKIGFFDVRISQFGEEHCDYTYRAMHAGMVRIDHVGQTGVDVDHDLCKLQDVPSSLSDVAKALYSEQAVRGMREAQLRYRTERPFRPFMLRPVPFAGTGHCGLPVDSMPGYRIVSAPLCAHE